MAIKIQHVRQPTPHTCVHACLAMVTGANVNDLIDRFGNHGLSWHEEVTVLVEHKLWPTVIPSRQPHPFCVAGTYLVTVPSLNLPGKTHRVVVTVDDRGYWLYDPNEGREGDVKAYPSDGIQTGHARYLDVTHLDRYALRKMRPLAELA